MGLCESNYNKNNNYSYNNNNRIKEVVTDNSVIKKVNTYLVSVCQSVCKIIYQDKKGTGFLIKLKKANDDFYCLMTNEHVVREDMIKANEIITIKYNCERMTITINLNESERFIKYNSKFDISIIEILPKDSINENYFLLPYTDDINSLKNQIIYIPQFPEGRDLSYSEGYIKEININKYELTHTASTLNGSSGSPIFLENSNLVIGIHKEGHGAKIENYGLFLYPIIESLKTVLDEKYVWEEGDYYIGTLIHGLPNGNGKKYFKDGRIFEGNFVNGKRERFGKITFPNKKTFFYIGQYKNDIRNGKGKEFYENGNISYEGDFVNDKREGYGKEYFENGKLKYEGYFVNDKYEGNGKYYWEDGKYLYDGRWSNDKRNGQGKLIDKNGNVVYEGNFTDDKYEGYGKYIWEDGNYYIGEWYNNKRHGNGIEYSKDGILINKGHFFNDEFQG